MTKECHNCGKEILSDADFCGFCGGPLNDSKTNFIKNKFSYKTIVFALLAIVIICFATSSIISLFDTISDEPPIIVESCYSEYSPYFNVTDIYLTGVTTKDIGSGEEIACIDYVNITTINGAKVSGFATVEEYECLKKGEKIHIIITPYEKLNETVKNVSFNVTYLNPNGKITSYGNVTANVTSK